jgi:hypothetical protein
MFERVVLMGAEILREIIIDLIQDIEDVDLLDLIYKLLLAEG